MRGPPWAHGSAPVGVLDLRWLVRHRNAPFANAVGEPLAPFEQVGVAGPALQVEGCPGRSLRVLRATPPQTIGAAARLAPNAVAVTQHSSRIHWTKPSHRAPGRSRGNSQDREVARSSAFRLRQMAKSRRRQNHTPLPRARMGVEDTGYCPRCRVPAGTGFCLGVRTHSGRFEARCRCDTGGVHCTVDGVAHGADVPCRRASARALGTSWRRHQFR